MKTKLIFVVLVLLANKLSAQVFDSVTYYKKYTVIQLHRDLDVLLDKFEKIHPNYFKETPRDTVIRRYRELKARIDKPLTRIDFMNLFAPVVYGVIKDGHNYVNAPEEDLNEYINRAGVFFPLPIVIRDKKLFVNSVKTAIPYNSEIKSVNGISARDIAETILKSYNPESEVYKEGLLSGDFSRLYWFNYGLVKQFEITYAGTGDIKQITVPGISLKQVGKLRGQPQSISNNYLVNYPNYGFYTLPETNTGVIEYRACDGLEQFRPFCDSVFSKMKKDGIKNVIIDIRNNDGGTTRLNEILYEYLTDKPIAQYAEVDIKVSKEAKRDLIQANRKYAGWFKWYHYLYYPIYIRQNPKRKLLLTATNGTTVKQMFEPETPNQNNLLFNGRVYLLTNERTYSSAAIFAAAFKCYGLGTVIGQETGEPTCFTGDWVSVILPNTKLQCAISGRRFILACGKCDGLGVQPDYKVEDVDGALDFTKKMIVKNGIE